MLDKKCVLEKKIDITAIHTAFCQTFKEGNSSVGESHDFWEIACVINGTFGAATEKDVFSVRKNCMIIHPPMEFHRHFNPSSDETEFLIISFDASLMPHIKNSIYTLSPENVNELIEIKELLRNEFVTEGLFIFEPKDKNSKVTQEVKSRFEIFIMSVIDSETLPRENASPDYKRIVRHLAHNIERNLTLSLLAKELNMSVSNLKRVFSKYAGIGVMSYFTKLKIQKAIKLLESGMSVKEVSDMLSYSSQSAFCTAFKNATGAPPSSYRS